MQGNYKENNVKQDTSSAWEIFKSPLGWIEVQANATHLLGVWRVEARRADRGNAITAQAIRELVSYFADPETVFTTPCLLRGTAFRQRTWQALQRLAAGQRLSYSQLAREMGRPRSTRAVANAVAKNPFPIIIPCHRIIRADGSDSGYVWGAEAKAWLLHHEAG